MNDLETIKEILTRAGVVYSESRDVAGACLTITEGEGPKNLGYGGFMTQISFNPDDSLDSVGAWE